MSQVATGHKSSKATECFQTQDQHCQAATHRWIASWHLYVSGKTMFRQTGQDLGKLSMLLSQKRYTLPCISTSIGLMLKEKHHLHRALLNDLASTSKKTTYSNIRGKVQKIQCQLQHKWLNKMADEIQLFADLQGHEKILQCTENCLCWWEHTDHWQGKGSRMLGRTLSQCSQLTINHW